MATSRQDLLQDLNYLGEINRLLTKRGVESPNADGFGLLTPGELRDASEAFQRGITAVSFLATLPRLQRLAAREAEADARDAATLAEYERHNDMVVANVRDLARPIAQRDVLALVHEGTAGEMRTLERRRGAR